MKKSTFIKSVHKALRDGSVWRGSKVARGLEHVRYESYTNPREIYLEVISARNSSLSRREVHVDTVCKVLTDAGIEFTYPSGIWVYINFRENGVED